MDRRWAAAVEALLLRGPWFRSLPPSLIARTIVPSREDAPITSAPRDAFGPAHEAFAELLASGLPYACDALAPAQYELAA
jgi:hypothetical protein